MPLNEPQQAALLELLNSDLFKRATEEVLLLSDSPVNGLGAPEAGIALAQEKGVRQAFRLLRGLTTPVIHRDAPRPVNQLSRTRPTAPQ